MRDSAGIARTNVSNSKERLSVVLEGKLYEHIRVQAFLTRTSKAGYIRSLVEKDAEENPVDRRSASAARQAD